MSKKPFKSITNDFKNLENELENGTTPTAGVADEADDSALLLAPDETSS